MIATRLQKHLIGGLLQRNSLLCSSRLASSSVLPPLNLADVPTYNEPILTYLKGSNERKELEKAIKKATEKCEDVPIVIGGEEIRTKDVRYQVMPHNHQHKLAKFYYADQGVIKKAIDVAVKTQTQWDKTELRDRIRIWEKAADLMANEYRQELNAATMLGQSKTTIQAEIDSAAELIDFIRMNTFYLKEAAKYQPISENASVTKNSSRFRGIDGFVAAVAPFNFTAIGGNLAYTPAMMGNAVLWKPSDTAVLSNWVIFKIMREAGVPEGVVNFLPSDGPVFGQTITASKHLAGINFTGSVPTFQWLWKAVAQNLEKYTNFPRLIGECGGKNFHFVHPSAHVPSVVAGSLRSAFEYCGQKCSACSRAYVPASLWPEIKAGLIERHKTLTMGDPTDYSNFMAAVIDDKAFNRIQSYVEHAKNSKHLEIIAGGKCDNSKGYFVEPTIVVTKDPLDKMMSEEIFGPVLTIYVYEDKDIEKAIDLVNNTTPFALTGAVFAQDREFQKRSLDCFKMAAGNFYINDKSTGSVVGQQPFGGGRMSGTNDKAGGPHYILKWTTPQSIKETFVPQTDVQYPYMK